MSLLCKRKLINHILYKKIKGLIKILIKLLPIWHLCKRKLGGGGVGARLELLQQQQKLWTLYALNSACRLYVKH